ncbi:MULTISPECIES: hypothetical protein [Pseudoalteromonas]|uniref:hypothetical protein n=1 Tax=Pseudoalteromonas TaxID=53246 RepID=UPI0003040576|nr:MULTISPECIES: hypothetical protein [Pseudoalteromonas]MCF6145271.1 hypothetical protein [Pseudoalteromonas mariniglutinosa NCIMB 1770]
MSRQKLQDAWQAMRILKRFSLQQVRDAVQHTTLDSLKAFAKRLVAANAIAEHVDHEDVSYSILNSSYNPFEQPVNSGVTNKNSGRQRMWQSMRILNEFDAGQVASTANVSLSSARSYISILKKVGYIFVVKNAPRSGSLIERAGETTIYRMLKNTGPKRPIPKTKGVFDANTNKLVKFKEVKRQTVQIAPVTLGEAHDYN